MNSITRYIRHAIDVSFRDMSEQQLYEALEYIYDNNTEDYFKREYSYMLHDFRLPLANEIFNYGYYNIDWEDLDVLYFREYRELKYKKEEEENEEQEDDYTTGEEE